MRDGITGDVMFYYDRGSRGYHVVREILGGYRGNVQSDGYEAYEQFERMEGITVYGCWAHARRKFVDALQEDEKMAAEAIFYIRSFTRSKRMPTMPFSHLMSGKSRGLRYRTPP